MLNLRIILATLKVDKLLLLLELAVVLTHYHLILIRRPFLNTIMRMIMKRSWRKQMLVWRVTEHGSVLSVVLVLNVPGRILLRLGSEIYSLNLQILREAK